MPTLVTFFSPQSSEECGHFIEALEGTHPIPLPPLPNTPPSPLLILVSLSLSFSLILQQREGKISVLFILETVGPCAGFPSWLC